MTDKNNNSISSVLNTLRRYVPLAVWAIVILTIFIIPLRIIGYNFLPADDALRHAGKAVSGKPWSDILVLSQTYQIDHEFGWNLLLRHVHLWTNFDTDKLVVFSVIVLFLLVGWSALPWLKRPESWLVALLFATVVSDTTQRFLLGRPFALTIAVLLTILLMWQVRPAPPKWPVAIFLTALMAICAFMHGAWYLWVLPIAAFFLAGQFRWGLMLGMCWAAGVFIGAMFTGHPIDYPLQAVALALRAVGMHDTTRTLVTELRPFSGDVLAVVILGGLVIMRQLARLNVRPMTANPAFWLACLGWVLGFMVVRFWTDWGWPALLVLMTCDLQSLLQARFAIDSFRRLGLACGLAIATYLAITCDFSSRWTQNLTWQYLTPDNPDLAGWMPDKGGIFYTADMSLFYQTFFKNPHGDWRYMLGFESTWMPDEDFRVYHSVLWNVGDSKAYKPWVDKMCPEDRLVIRGARGGPPNIPQLEWAYGVSGIWVGRLPRIPQSGTPPPTVSATAKRESPTNSVSLPK